MNAHVLSVGQLYDPSRTATAPGETVRLGRSTPELVRRWQSPTHQEIAMHDEGVAEFALVDESPDLLVLAYRFGDLDWCDAPFQIHRLTTDVQAWPGGGSGSPINFRTVLVDAATGIVRSMRYDLWSVSFSNAVRVAVAEQLLHEASDERAGDRLDALYSEHRTPADMVAKRAGATTRSDNPSMGGSTGLSVHHY